MDLKVQGGERGFQELGAKSLSVQGPQATGPSRSPGWVEKIVRVGKLGEEVGSRSSACVQSKQLFFIYLFLLCLPLQKNQKRIL